MHLLKYLLEVSACSGLLYSFYQIAFKRFTFFKINRLYLLSTLILSILIPLLNIELTSQPEYSTNLDQFNGATRISESAGVANFSNLIAQFSNGLILNIEWEQLFMNLYLIGAMLIFFIAIYRIIQLLKSTRNINLKIDGLKIIYKSEGFTNCSFFNFVFIDRGALTDEEFAVVLKHELAHASAFHSMDKLFLTLLKALLWFNPFIYLYDKSLEMVHEYEADNKASTVIGSCEYAELLLKIIINNPIPSLSHSFTKHPVKSRIQMLFTNKSNGMKKLSYILVLPVALLLTYVFGIQISNANETFAEVQNISKEKSDIIKNPKEKTKQQSAIDRYNKAVTQRAESMNKFYMRYTLKKADGTEYDFARLKLANGSFAGADMPKGNKPTILINNSPYTEDEASKLSMTQPKISTISATDSMKGKSALLQAY